jgi:hypothetical protein
MEQLLRDPSLRERMGREGRRVAEQRFSLATAGKVFLEKYDEVLNVRAGELRNGSSSLSQSAEPVAQPGQGCRPLHVD